MVASTLISHQRTRETHELEIHALWIVTSLNCIAVRLGLESHVRQVQTYRQGELRTGSKCCKSPELGTFVYWMVSAVALRQLYVGYQRGAFPR